MYATDLALHPDGAEGVAYVGSAFATYTVRVRVRVKVTLTLTLTLTLIRTRTRPLTRGSTCSSCSSQLCSRCGPPPQAYG